MALQAIIMAGGEGVRLRPLTERLPKPLVPLLGEPCVGYALRLLRRHGLDRIGATLWYRPECIRSALGDGAEWGVNLKYYEETAPLGTAGSVRMAMEELTETFFVLSGDGLTDLDLTAALRFHREKGALATLVLKRTPIPLPYGVVVTEEGGRITRFVEKPGWNRVVSDLVNTGVYILEPEIFRYIPDTGMPDFGKDIFPALTEKGLPVFGYETEAYWCDIGDQRAYLTAQTDLLAGKVDLPHPVGIDASARIDPAAAVEDNCWVGPRAVIGPGARLSHALIGADCVIGGGADVTFSCLWTGAALQEKARVTGSVLCEGAQARTGAELSDGCALGEGAVAGAYALLRPGVKVGPHLKVAAGAVANRSVVSAEAAMPPWSPWGADWTDAESACGLCGAFLKVTGARRVICAGENGAHRALAAGALADAGARVLLTEDVPWPMLQTLIAALRLEGGVHAGAQALRFADGAGQPLTPKQQSAVTACLLRREAGSHRKGSIRHLSGAEEIYLAALMPPEDRRALRENVAVFSDSPLIRELAAEALTRMHAVSFRCLEAAAAEALTRMHAVSFRCLEAAAAEAFRGETGLMISRDGETLTVFTREKAYSGEETAMLLLFLVKIRQGKLYDLPGVPRAAEGIAPLLKADDSPECRFQRRLMQDGLAAAVLICQGLKDFSLSDMTAALPETHVVTREIPVQMEEKGRVVRELCRQVAFPRSLGEGVRFSHPGGWATVAPDAHRPSVRVTSEAGDAEFARELCDRYTDRIAALTDRQKMEQADKNIPFSP